MTTPSQNTLQNKYPWGPYRALATKEAALAQRAESYGGWRLFAYEFIRFGIKQGWACLFGGLMVALLIGTYLWYPKDAALARYDFLVIASVAIQIFLLAFKMETWEEAKVILLFHIVGTVMEIFKTHVGSWHYPEPSILRIGGVPLFTGFMYASVGSYIARVWRLFDFRFSHHPSFPVTIAISFVIYANFFTHHYFYDLRWIIMIALVVIFGRTRIYFRVWKQHRWMPLLLGFLLVAVFIWFAENIGTFTNAWLYPSQVKGWSMVSINKLGSWFMLVIISYVMVSILNKPEEI
ncbi:DUF817 domain-containing protein [Microvirga sp. W0021]|uniref:DUF817 domain-containing protein n=1 Tax=Hohaiivirga grylli TaxID=3133970 RepID=A0ABV0BHJ1_9HYPH